MATFSYQAKDSGGNTINGVVEALDERSAANAIREMGFYPIRIFVSSGAVMAPSLPNTPDSASPLAPRMGTQSTIHAAPFLMGVPLDELAMMYRQLATLANAGVPLTQSLFTLVQQTRDGRLRRILEEAGNAVASGNTLSQTMVRYPAVFSEMQVEMIRAAEMSGMLEPICNRIADYLEREIEMRRKINRETLYPKLVFFVAGCVVLLLGFLRAGAEGFFGMVRFGVTTALILFGGWWLFKFLNQMPWFGAAWDRVKMMIPGPGGVARRYATARFTRALAVLYGSGILLPTAVTIAGRACGNRAIGQQMIDLVPMLMSGRGIGEVLAMSGLLSPIAVQMARTGEQTGSLDTMMHKVADYLESEADQKAHQQAIFLGVAAIIIAGIVVAFIAIGFYVGQVSSAISEIGGQ
jgi:type II secretory pathway component PulF